MRQFRDRPTKEPMDRERQLRQRMSRTRHGHSTAMQNQSRVRMQQSIDQNKRERRMDYRDAAPRSCSTVQAPQTHMQYLDVLRPQNQSQTQSERIQFLPRVPQRGAGSEARGRARTSNRQSRQALLKQDETQARRRTRNQKQAQESSLRDSSNLGGSGRRLYRGTREQVDDGDGNGDVGD